MTRETIIPLYEKMKKNEKNVLALQYLFKALECHNSYKTFFMTFRSERK